MSSKAHKHQRKEAKNLHVTSRCVAIVFSPADTLSNKSRETETDTHGERLAVSEKGNNFNPKDVLEDFKIRNRNCYWNPALVDSVKSLEYVGFLEPHTVLVKGDDIHLENIRTAWGRRVLKDPADFHIDRIGDVNGIQMQVIPQTQFIPLPEALCLIIMDLNNNQIVATLDTICEKMQLCYQGHHLPSNQLVYDTLGTLIRERKVFHTGFGYFVVTPDTFRLHAEDQLASTWNTAWTHLHPMYIPAAFSQPPRVPMRSISCQVDEVEKPVISQNESGDSTEFGLPNSNAIQVDLPPPRLQRSMSLSVRRPRESSKKEDTSEKGLKRSSSVKGRSENKVEVISKDTEEKTEQKPEKLKAEKLSLFAKLFGRNKKKLPTSQKPAVEYATFSAQFPPPEWTWYQQQLEKHIRTETWVQQQIVKSGTWHHFQNTQQDIGVGSHAVSERGTVQAGPHPSLNPVNLNLDTRTPDESKFKREGKRHSSRNKTKHKDKPAMVIANMQRERAIVSEHLPKCVTNSVPAETPGQRLRLSSLPTRLSPPGAVEMPQSDCVHPMYMSTPRWTGAQPGRLQDSHTDNTVDHSHTNPLDPYIKRTSIRKSHQPKRHSHHESQSNFNATYQSEDISCEYQGKLPKKTSAMGVSRDSGVNCIGLSKEGREHRVNTHKPYSFKETDLDFDMTIRHGYQRSDVGRSGAANHIYANVEINQPTASHNLSKRQIERPPHIDADRPSRSASYRQYKSEKRKNQSTSSQRLKLEAQDLSCYKTELSKLCEERSESVKAESASSHEKTSHESAREGTCSSEHSVGTVINTKTAGAKTARHKQVNDLLKENHLSLGDSGFSSPRVSEISSDSKKSESSCKHSDNKCETNEGGSKNEIYRKISKKDSERRNSDLSNIQSSCRKNDSNLIREKRSLLCNNTKNAKPLNNSLGDLDRVSNDSVFGTITSDALYENVKLDQTEVLNNMKYLHKEITVSSQNLNTPQPDITAESTETFDIKQPQVGKFKLEGDFHVVGVV